MREADRLSRNAGLRELLRHPVLQAVPGGGDHRSDPGPFGLAEGRQQRQIDRLVVAVVEVRAGTAEGREAGRPGRYQDLVVGDPVGVAGDVQRSASAVTEQGVVGGRVALAEDPPDRLVAKRLLEQLDHSGGRRGYVEAERTGD